MNSSGRPFVLALGLAGCGFDVCGEQTPFEIAAELSDDEIDNLAASWGVYPAELSCDQVCSYTYEQVTGATPDFIELCDYSAPMDDALGTVSCEGTGVDTPC